MAGLDDHHWHIVVWDSSCRQPSDHFHPAWHSLIVVPPLSQFMHQVRPADPHPPSLAEAPAGTRVVELTHYTDTADLVIDAQSCQACAAPVEISHPHLRAIIRRPHAGGSSTFDRPVFCGQRCYARWASGE